MKQKFAFQAIHMLFVNSQEGLWGLDEENVARWSLLVKICTGMSSLLAF